MKRKVTMIKISFPDGRVQAYESGISAMDIAKSISEGLARNVLAAKVNDQVWDRATMGCSIKWLVVVFTMSQISGAGRMVAQEFVWECHFLVGVCHGQGGAVRRYSAAVSVIGCHLRQPGGH